MRHCFYIFWFWTMALMCHGQGRLAKTLVFRVKAPLSKCTIVSKDSPFYLEKDSDVEIRLKGRSKKIRVKVNGARVLSENNNVYKLRFLNPGKAVVSVYQDMPDGAKLIATKSYDIIAPKLFFCGVPVDSSTKQLRLGPCHMYAYSDCFKKQLPVSKFTMLFYEDIRARGRKAQADTFHSDACKLSADMKQKVLRFQPKTNKIYFYNILCGMPDGSFRVLEPIELIAMKDSLLQDFTVIYTVRKKKVD